MLRDVDVPSKDRYRRKSVVETSAAGRGAGVGADARDPRDRAMPGGLVGRLAGGALALVVLGAAVVGLVLGTRTTRLYHAFEAQLTAAAVAELTAHLRATAHELAPRVVAADGDEDWSPLQSSLPARASVDPDLIALFITDAEGLVLADADPTRNGRPLADERLRAILRRVDAGATEIVVESRPALVVVDRVSVPDKIVRLVWVVGSEVRVRAAQRAVAQAGHDAVRFGWLLIALGGFLVALVALGVVVLVGGSFARRLQTVSWRIGQLGRGDHSTHLVLDGPLELRQVAFELELATRRIVATERARRAETAVSALAEARGELVAAGTVLPPELAGLSVARALPRVAQSSAAGSLLHEGGALFWMIEVVGDALEDVVVAAELSSATAALARAEPTLGPAALIARLDAETRPQHSARAIVLSIEDGGARVRVASAGARFPLLQRAGEPVLAPVVVRGDRLGEPRAERPAEITLTLAVGDALYLVGEPPPCAASARDGHVGRELQLRAAALATTATASERAQALIADDAIGCLIVALLRS